MLYVHIIDNQIVDISDVPIVPTNVLTPEKTEQRIIKEAIYESLEFEDTFINHLVHPEEVETVVVEPAVYEELDGEVVETDLLVTLDWTYEDGIFVPPLDLYKQNALVGVDKEHADTLRNLTGNATIEERDTWQSKALAAQAIKDGTATPSQTLMIGTEARLSGKDVEDLVNSILASNDEFMVLIGFAAGHRSSTRKAINEAETPEELEAVIIAARAEAENIIGQLNA